MRWDELPRSDNIDDRRDGDPGPIGPGGGFPIGGGGLSIGTVVVLGLIGWALGIDPSLLIGGAEMLSRNQPQIDRPMSPGPNAQRRTGTPKDETGDFVAAILGSADAEWKVIFQKANQTYRGPRLVMFHRGTRSACGSASSAMGPFYCPADREVYLDTSFFRDLEVRFRGCTGSACNFSRAYVIAHEVGHHVQNIIGILPRVQQQQRNMDRAAANRLQVRVELQADCFAGVWAHHAEKKYKFLDPGDIDAALQTAAAIGDDMLQKRGQGYVVPDSFTHGTSEQRKRWFTTGFQQGTVSSCNTFSAQARL
jgi:predicted metalloprotease